MTDSQEMQNNHFNVWITSVSDSYTEAVVGRLVRRGWEVKSLGKSLSLGNEDNLAVLIAIAIARQLPANDVQDTVTIIYDEIKDVLKAFKVKYYSLVVIETSACTWSLGNVTKSLIEESASERKKGTN